MGDKRRSILWMIIAVLVILALACGESTPTTETTVRTATPAVESEAPSVETEEEVEQEEPAVVEEEPAAAEEETEAPAEIYLGDAIGDYGYALVAIEVEDPAPSGMFYTEQAGKKLVAVRLVVANISGDPHTVNALYAVLLDEEGFAHDLELAGRDGQIATAQVEPGEKVEGWVAFAIDEGSAPTALRYDFGGLFGSKVVRISLVSPPDGYEPSSAMLDVTPDPPQARLGDVAEVSGYSLSAVSVDDPATPGILYRATEGYKLVAVEIVLGNDSGDTFSVNPLYTYLVDDRGYVYSAELAGTEKDQIATLDLGPGEKVKGWVGFTIPEDATPAAVKFQLGALSSDFLRVGVSP